MKAKIIKFLSTTGLNFINLTKSSIIPGDLIKKLGLNPVELVQQLTPLVPSNIWVRLTEPTLKYPDVSIMLSPSKLKVETAEENTDSFADNVNRWAEESSK